jgi:DNA-binding response OmpR family regulator
LKQTILVVDDDPLVHKLIGRSLADHGFSVLQATTGEEGLRVLRRDLPDLVVLDLGLNGIGGMDVLGAIKNDKTLSSVPVIVLTGSDDEKQDVVCLDGGADDYVLKDFRGEVLLARVRAVLRRAQFKGGNNPVLEEGKFSIDTARRAVIFKDRIVENLTSKEFDLLFLLVQNSPQVLSRSFLARKIWKGQLGIVSERTIDVHIRRVRLKLGAEAAKCIVTVSGHGYKFVENGVSD